MNKIVLALMAGMFFLQSCLDDSGNYSYSDLIPIEVDSTNIASSYRITQWDYLVIDPAVKQGTDDSNLSYEWRIFQSSGMPNTETGEIIDDVVGTERKLNYQVTTPPGSYTLGFTITDKQNGVSTVLTRPINIESFAPVGLMVIHGDADSSDVSILVNDRIVPDVTKDEVEHNIFSSTNGHRVPGAPGKVAYIINTQSVYIFTKGSDGGYRSRGSDLEVLDAYADMFTDPLAENEINFQDYNAWSYNDILINDGKLYFAMQASTTFTQFGVPAFGMEYYAEPFIGVNDRGIYQGVFYDRLSKRFLYVDYQKTVKEFMEPVGGSGFNMNDVGMDMVYAEHGFNNYWYCLMRDPEAETNYYVYVCNITVGDYGTVNIGAARYDVSACTDLKDATAFSVSNRADLLFYATPTEVKLCNYTNSGNAGVSLYSLPDDLIAEGYEINMLWMFKESSSENNGKLLYVGIYNEAADEGKLLECQIVETSGEIVSVKTYDGFKRITHLDYKSL